MKQVISLNRLHKAQVWYNKPIEIRLKKSWIIWIGLIILAYFIGTGQVHAQGVIYSGGSGVNQTTPNTSFVKFTDKENKAGVFNYSKNPSQDLVDEFKQINDQRAAEALKAAQEAQKQAEEAKEAQLRASQVAESVVTIQPVYQPTVNCGSDPYMAWIYSHESGCNTASTNSQGCFGLGQDCNGVVRNQCGTDWDCQNAYFTNYATRRYGSPAGAVAFWQSHGWY